MRAHAHKFLRDSNDEEEHEGPLQFAAVDDPMEDEDPLCCCCERIGNMHVICEVPARRDYERRLICVVGPHWRWALFVTTPLILLPSVYVMVHFMPRVEWPLYFAFMIVLMIVLTSLWCTGCSDPGLVIKRDKCPKDANEKEWAFEDRTESWRPLTAHFSADCNVLVDGYDHTCPWTGTAIGKRNIVCFYIFTYSIFPLLVLLLVCVIVAEIPGHPVKTEQ